MTRAGENERDRVAAVDALPCARAAECVAGILRRCVHAMSPLHWLVQAASRLSHFTSQSSRGLGRRSAILNAPPSSMRQLGPDGNVAALVDSIVLVVQALDRWEERLEAAFEGRPYDELDATLTDTLSQFPVDIQPFRCVCCCCWGCVHVCLQAREGVLDERKEAGGKGSGERGMLVGHPVQVVCVWGGGSERQAGGQRQHTAAGTSQTGSGQGCRNAFVRLCVNQAGLGSCCGSSGRLLGLFSSCLS